MKKIYPYSAVITAYKNDETVDLENTRVQMRRQIKNGNNLLVCGTNGDFASLLTDEKKAIISAVITSYSIHYTKLYEENPGLCSNGSH